MAFGVTSAGFKAKRLADIKSELEASFKGVFGNNINLDARGPFGQIIGLMAEELETQWELAEETYNSEFPQNAQGIGVDNTLDLVGLRRKNPTNSTAFLTFYGDPTTVIPVGSQVSRPDIPTTIFEVDAAGTINAGTGTDEVQRIDFSAVPDAGDWEVDFDGQTTNTLAFNITNAQLQTELENLSNVGAGNISVSGDFSTGFVLTFQNALGEADQPQITIPTNNLTSGGPAVSATPSTTTGGVRPNVTVTAAATETGSLDAPAGTLTNLDTPIAGVDNVTNLLDAELGQDLESDADAKARRNESVAIPGHSTVPAIFADLLQLDGVEAVRIFENESFVELDGRPPKSYEAVIQGGDDTEIAQELLDTKGAGIQLVGSTSVVLKDIQGFDKTVFFSRPTAVPIYLEVDLKTNAEFPANGLQAAEDALLAFGDALNISDDVIVIPKLLCSLESISGIIDVDIRIGVNVIPAQLTPTVVFVNTFSELTVDLAAHGLLEGNRVKFTTDGTLPTGLAADTLYFVRNPTANQFRLSEARTSDIIGYIDSGAGTHTMQQGGFDENIAIDDAERADFDSSRITVVQV